MIGRRRGGISLGRVAKKAAVATVVNRVVNNAMDNRVGNRGVQQPVQPQQVMNNICPSCNSGNPQNAKFCLNCGSGFAAQSAHAQPAGQQQAAPLNNCPGCKANLTGVNGNFCPYCRSAIN